MFGSLGMPELILIFAVALILFGPRQLPHIGRSLGRALGEFRRASNDFKRTIEEEVAADELRAVGREVRNAGRELTQADGDGAAGKTAAEPPATDSGGSSSKGERSGDAQEQE